MGLAWGTNDLPYYAYRTLIAAVLEENIGLMCAFLLGCRPVTREVKRWFGRNVRRGDAEWPSSSEIKSSKQDSERQGIVPAQMTGNDILAPEPAASIGRYWQKDAANEQETRGRSMQRTR